MSWRSPRWHSTRSTDRQDTVSFVEALRQGLAPDGGLYVPTEVPALPVAWTARRGVGAAGRLSGSTPEGPEPAFVNLATEVLAPWLVDSFDREAWEEAVRSSLSFPVPVVPLGGAWEGVHVLELFHGPTLSFKDFGARTMARLLAAAPDPAGGTRHVFVATSGDTGSAVADGFAGIQGLNVVLLFPKGQVSEVQERQLVALRPGVRALRVAGTFDDCQRLVKGAFADRRFDDLRPSSANSINAGRLLPQMLYYVHARTVLGGEPLFCVPSGNLGNMTAGILAHLGGMPNAGFVAAHNRNDGFVGYLGGGAAPSGASVRTLSNAMDVGAPSNFERLQSQLGEGGIRSLIQGDAVDDDDTLRSMRQIYEETGYVADPHTAVGLEVVRRRRAAGSGRNTIVLSTAHPAKFPDVIERALGFAPDEPEALAVLRNGASRVSDIPPSLDALLAAVTGTTG